MPNRPTIPFFGGAAAVLAATFLGGCETRLPSGTAAWASAPRAGIVARVCARGTGATAMRAVDADALLSPPDAFRAAAERLAAHGFSRTAITIADTIGALPMLEQLPALEARRVRTIGAEVRLFRVRQAIADKILLATLDVSSTLAAIDCEGERGDQLRERLQRIENRRTRRLGLASIMVGATTAALSGGLSLAGTATGSAIVGIAGGTAEAGVATALLFGSASGELRTDRNLMREIWDMPALSSLFPRTVWRFLTRRPRDEPARPTVAESVVAEWRAGERLGPARSRAESERIALLFGSGGSYTVEELEMRDAMLDLLEASVALMSQELRVLLDELVARPRAERRFSAEEAH